VAELLARRYRMLEKIGEGGMAVVYKAHCTLLDRPVAIKVLREQYASNPEFVDRFQREARAAARLSHPNIVSIYDVGQEGEKLFIVMEYVQGVNLKDYLRNQGPLSPQTAAELGRQIGAALAHAHQRGIIHRDIKPHNILISPDGQVKVTDFGIARAAAASSLTETGVVLGSVHYFSPEQARGGSVDARSDIYALGVVLYELLTGRLPFEGDSPIAIALRHLDSEPLPFAEVRPDVPVELQQIIAKAMAREPEKRYQTAGELQVALRSFLGDVPLVDEPTRALNPVAAPALGTDAKERGRKVRTSGFVFSLIILLFLAVLGGGLLALRSYFMVPVVEVPNVVGRSEAEAKEMIESRDLVFRVLRSEYDEAPPGTVISQEPPAHSRRKAGVGEVVEVILSLGEEKAEVPDVRGQTLLAAEAALSENGLTLGAVREEHDAVTPAGLVLAQDPPPQNKLSVGAKVNLVVSLGPPPLPRILPDFSGRDLAAVQAELRDLNLVPASIRYEPSNIYSAGKVIRTDPPAASEVLEGDEINLVVSDGPPLEPQQEEKVTYNLHLTVPDGPDQRLVEVWVLGQFDADRVYRRNLQPGATLELALSVYPGSTIRVDIDGKAWKEYPVSDANGQ
jgi:beta-lactam-binding protein with PASTA domain/tRNA A-37 threonylcarbamoyl transferase component Bud32